MERLVPIIPPVGQQMRIIIDTDAANEIDDLYAIALALASNDRFKIEGFVATHFAAHSFAGPDSIDESYDVINTLLEKAGLKGQIPVVCGGHPMQYFTVPSESEGCDFIIQQAKLASPQEPLWVLALGAATNLASAILKDPSIIPNVRYIFHARSEDTWPERSTQFNIRGDVLAVMAILESNVPLVWFDTGTHITASFEETERRIATTGALGEYIHNYRKNNDWYMQPWKGFFDLGDVAWLIQPDICTAEVEKVMSMDQTMHFTRDKDLGNMLRITDIDRDSTWDILEERLKKFNR